MVNPSKTWNAFHSHTRSPIYWFWSWGCLSFFLWPRLQRPFWNYYPHPVAPPYRLQVTGKSNGAFKFKRVCYYVLGTKVGVLWWLTDLTEGGASPGEKYALEMKQLQSQGLGPVGGSNKILRPGPIILRPHNLMTSMESSGGHQKLG
jgi:hypothetical protein